LPIFDASIPVPKLKPVLEPQTSRLRLRQWRDEDYVPFAAMNADPLVMAHFPRVLTREESDGMAERCRALIANRGWGIWAVELQATNQFIGFVGLHTPGYDLPFNPCVEMGWRLAKEFWGQGLAIEAAKECARVAFEQLNLDEIVAFTALSNQRSQAVMQRLNMTRTDENFAHPAVDPASPLSEHCLYRLTRKVWQTTL